MLGRLQAGWSLCKGTPALFVGLLLVVFLGSLCQPSGTLGLDGGPAGYQDRTQVGSVQDECLTLLPLSFRLSPHPPPKLFFQLAFKCFVIWVSLSGLRELWQLSVLCPGVELGEFLAAELVAMVMESSRGAPGPFWAELEGGILGTVCSGTLSPLPLFHKPRTLGSACRGVFLGAAASITQ